MAWDKDGFCLRCQRHLNDGCECRGISAERKRRNRADGQAAEREHAREPDEAADGAREADDMAAAPSPAGQDRAPGPEPDTSEDRKPAIRTGTGPETIRAIQEAIDAAKIPDTYVTSGCVVHVEKVSGTLGGTTGEEDSPLPVTPSEVTSAMLAGLLARYTYTYKTKPSSAGGGSEEVTPSNAALAAALARKEWARLPPLYGIVGAPVLRRDGSLLQQPGYDEATGLYLGSKVPLDVVPDEPTREQVQAARQFLLDDFLGDFPWTGPADKANYMGLLVTPILRSYLRTLIPFGVVTSTMPGSGKTILTCGLGMLYGQRVLTWPGSDEAELRKAITSVLADPVGVIIFDNLAEGTVIDSPALARLITDRQWADRILGKSATVAFDNDRVWAATGNNLRLGGDMRTRSVLVELNPNMPRPEERTGFAIPNLDQWILAAANQRKVLWHLLVLVTDWTRRDAPRAAGPTMRQFTTWAEAVRGFLAHHRIEGFLANAETVRDIDDDEADWTAFLAQWRKLFGDRWLTSNELRQSANTIDIGGQPADRWDGLFRTDNSGKPLAPRALGKILTGQKDRWRGTYVLHSRAETHTKVKLWRVDEWEG
jgi:hypothetical protein